MKDRTDMPPVSLAALLAGAAIFGVSVWRREKRQTSAKPGPAFHHVLPGDPDAPAEHVGGRARGPRARYSRSIEAVRAADKGTDRGRDATDPTGIPWRGWRDILLRVWREIGEDHLGLIAAGVAFYGVLAVFPATAVAVAFTGLVTEPGDFVGLLNEVSPWIPPDAARLLHDQAAAVAGSRSEGLTLAALIGLAFAIWSASRGLMSLIEGLNVVYDETERRGIVRLNLTALALTLVVIAGTLVGLTAAVIIPAVLAVFGEGTGLAAWLPLLRWPILFAGTVLGLALIYRFGPCREQAQWTWLSPGALLACLLWIAATWGFSYYVANFSSYNQTFGTLAGAIVLLMWLWLSSCIVLIGAELNAEIEAQTARDSTTGPEMPMGARGAVKADSLGLPVD